MAESSSTNAPLILVVDDEPTVRMIHTFLLQHLGYKPVEAEDGREALDFIMDNEQNVTGMILDLAMPVMDGIDLLERLKELNRVPPKTCVVSAGTRKLDNPREAIIQELELDFYTKPASPEKLQAFFGGKNRQ